MRMTGNAQAVAVSRNVLFVLAAVDLIRAIMHTFFLNWAALNVARIDPHPDALMLLGVFGNSNFLTAGVFALIAWKARDLAGYVLGIIPVAYGLGILGIRLNGVSMQSDFNGQYMMMVYFAVCIITFLYFIRRR
ncbi:MAG: hypothetical protein EA383_11125 [Spirochaetaceae bacterium]|nr:MAG: hypothetical protein EA383_11125 [Spirochaetaceae bacterium]